MTYSNTHSSSQDKGLILFAVNGLGLGNSTRCYAIIQELSKSGYRIAVATSGNGIFFFRGKPELSSIHSLYSMEYAKTKERKLNAFGTLLGIPRFLYHAWRNGRLLLHLIKALRPSAIVYDSTYNIMPRFFSRIPILAVNNADMVAHFFLKLRNKPLNIYPQFFLVEFPDFLFHRLIPDHTISPWLVPSAQSSADKKSTQLELIVRKPFAEDRTELSSQARKVVIMLSGSTLGSKIDPSEWGLTYSFEVIGRSGTDSELIHYHGKITEDAEILSKADVLILNGGYSAVAEGLALKKPLIIIPVENHAEQYINARIVTELGAGLMASESDVKEKLETLCHDYVRFRNAYASLRLPVDGSAVAARLIAQTCEKELSQKEDIARTNC